MWLAFANHFLLGAFVFHGIIVVSLTCAAYHWGIFIEAICMDYYFKHLLYNCTAFSNPK
jgi:hypothetical protein